MFTKNNTLMQIFDEIEGRIPIIRAVRVVLEKRHSSQN